MCDCFCITVSVTVSGEQAKFVTRNNSMSEKKPLTDQT